MEPPTKSKGVGVGSQKGRAKQNHSRSTRSTRCTRARTPASHASGHLEAGNPLHSGVHHSRMNATVHPVRYPTECCMTQNRGLSTKRGTGDTERGGRVCCVSSLYINVFNPTPAIQKTAEDKLPAVFLCLLCSLWRWEEYPPVTLRYYLRIFSAISITLPCGEVSRLSLRLRKFCSTVSTDLLSS